MNSLRGQLLIASPALVDQNFARTVVLIAEHNDEGALGVVLNRPTPATIGDIVPSLETLVGADEHIHLGGPVAREGVLLLAEFEDPDASLRIIFENVGFLAADRDELDDDPPGTVRARAFAGHSGWGPEQLEAELERDDWVLERATVRDVFTEDPDALWSAVLERKGGQFALLARIPPDPSVN
jgi:putative transcriptional regulator